MSRHHGVGIIGAGNISAAYLRLAPQFENFEIRAIASRSQTSATARAIEFGIEALSIDQLLAREDLSAIINLTVPDSHCEVSKAILSAGKHVYSEKPFALSLEEGRCLLSMAEQRGLAVASAPDTILGGAHQQARRIIDSGALGDIAGGTCQFMNRGMEHRHPNPGFFFKFGGGPVLDVAPYYVTSLVSLLGPVARVSAFGTRGRETRLVTAPGPRNGDEIQVDVLTTAQGVMEFASGTVIGVGFSWDVVEHGHSNHIELYGTTGSLFLPDPDYFGGSLVYVDLDRERRELSSERLPFGEDNEFIGEARQRANYRGIGLADMLQAVDSNEMPRCDGTLALHVVEVMNGLVTAATERRIIDMETTCSRPRPLEATDAAVLSHAGSDVIIQPT